jgi:hypothetical protein
MSNPCRISEGAVKRSTIRTACRMCVSVEQA